MGYSIEPLQTNLDISESQYPKDPKKTCDCRKTKICNKFFGRFHTSTKQAIKSLLLAYLASVVSLKLFCMVGVSVITTSDILLIALLPCCGFAFMTFLVWRRVIEVYSEGLRVRIFLRFWNIRWKDIIYAQQMDNGNIVIKTMIINEIVLPASIRKIPTLLECVRSHVGDEHVFTLFLMNKGLTIN